MGVARRAGMYGLSRQWYELSLGCMHACIMALWAHGGSQVAFVRQPRAKRPWLEQAGAPLRAPEPCPKAFTSKPRCWMITYLALANSHERVADMDKFQHPACATPHFTFLPRPGQLLALDRGPHALDAAYPEKAKDKQRISV